VSGYDTFVTINGTDSWLTLSASLPPYLATVANSPVPEHGNPAEHALELLNDDFKGSESKSDDNLLEKHAAVDRMITTWSTYAQNNPKGADMAPRRREELETFSRMGVWEGGGTARLSTSQGWFVRPAHQTLVLCHRTLLLYSRNLLAWGVRLGMYLGMGILLATVWANLGRNTKDTEINDLLSVHFFSVAFLGFMSGTYSHAPMLGLY